MPCRLFIEKRTPSEQRQVEIMFDSAKRDCGGRSDGTIHQRAGIQRSTVRGTQRAQTNFVWQPESQFTNTHHYMNRAYASLFFDILSVKRARYSKVQIRSHTYTHTPLIHRIDERRALQNEFTNRLKSRACEYVSARSLSNARVCHVENGLAE